MRSGAALETAGALEPEDLPKALKPCAQVLPEVTADRWQYHGMGQSGGRSARVWRLFLEPSEGYGAYHSNYTLYVTKVSPRRPRP